MCLLSHRTRIGKDDHTVPLVTLFVRLLAVAVKSLVKSGEEPFKRQRKVYGLLFLLLFHNTRSNSTVFFQAQVCLEFRGDIWFSESQAFFNVYTAEAEVNFSTPLFSMKILIHFLQ
jgi:hypothetical protein